MNSAGYKILVIKPVLDCPVKIHPCLTALFLLLGCCIRASRLCSSEELQPPDSAILRLFWVNREESSKKQMRMALIYSVLVLVNTIVLPQSRSSGRSPPLPSQESCFIPHEEQNCRKFWSHFFFFFFKPLT